MNHINFIFKFNWLNLNIFLHLELKTTCLLLFIRWSTQFLIPDEMKYALLNLLACFPPVCCMISGMLITSSFFFLIFIILLGIQTERNLSKIKYIGEIPVLWSNSALLCYVSLPVPILAWMKHTLVSMLDCAEMNYYNFQWSTWNRKTLKMKSHLQEVCELLQFSWKEIVSCMDKFIWALGGYGMF